MVSPFEKPPSIPASEYGARSGLSSRDYAALANIPAAIWEEKVKVV